MTRPVAVITGGSAGIGRAAAQSFVQRGWAVALLARGEERIEMACAQIRATGGVALGVAADVADAAQVEAAAERVERELGPIDVWVNNAATSVFGPVEAITPEEYRQVLQVTFLGCVHGTLSALRRMRARNAGCIVQTGSALAYRSIPLQSAYCAAKAAARGFTDALRCELIRERSRVRLTMVHLSAFNTPQFDWVRSKLPRRLQPVPPIFQPEAAGEAIAWAALHPRRETWVGWPAVKAILSARFAPALGDRLAAYRAYEAQQTGEPARRRADSLFAPAPGAHGAHGRFNARSHARLWQWSISRHRWSLVAAIVLAAAVVLALA
jgi:NAD(P)-dependent dehydrogenase (short-subunit alcohol dehydrogenase family)